MSDYDTPIRIPPRFRVHDLDAHVIDTTHALRVVPDPPPAVRYIYAGGKRYRVTDANRVVDGLFEQGRPGHLTP